MLTAVFMRPRKLQFKREVTLELKPWYHLCILPFGRDVLRCVLRSYSACLLFFAVEIALSNTPFCPLSNLFLYHICFFLLKFPIYRSHPTLRPIFSFSQLCHHLPSFSPFRSTWHPKFSFPVVHYLAASSAGSSFSSFGVQTPCALHCHVAISYGSPC